MDHCHESLSGFPVVITVPVLWGDQDAFGHVNNLVYLRWCETARVEYLDRVGLWVPLPPEGVGPILASVSCDYKRPLNYPGTVHVGARVTRIGNSSFKMEHVVVSHDLGTVAATADSTLVLLDYGRNKTVPVPAEARKRIGDLEGRLFEPVTPSHS
jgi:acyl-CoA thioester hydrolase